MNANDIAVLLELIAQFMHSEGSWLQKRNSILEEATKSDRINLKEFSTLFEVD